MAKSVKRIAFSDEQIFLLIELYRRNDCLWNSKSPLYKNNIKRKVALANIAEKMGIDEETVKKKMASIRATYLMERKKIADSRRKGTGSGELYKPTVPWFEHMVFLNDVIIIRKTTSNLDSEVIQDEGGLDKESQENGKIGQVNTSLEPETATSKMYWKSSQLKKRRKSSLADNSSEKSIDAAIDRLCKIEDQDVFDNFGNLIASQLKSIPMEDALQLQMEISHIVNNRLIMIHRAKSVSSEFSRTSTSFTNYSNCTGYISEDNHSYLSCKTEPQIEDSSNSCETEDVSRALQRIPN